MRLNDYKCVEKMATKTMTKSAQKGLKYKKIFRTQKSWITEVKEPKDLRKNDLPIQDNCELEFSQSKEIAIDGMETETEL